MQQAAELDRRLMSGEFDARPAAVIQIVDRLLALRDELERRPMADLVGVRDPRSPNDGMIEDVAPFGDVDPWRAKRNWATQRLHDGGSGRPGRGTQHRPGQAAVSTAGGSPGHAKPPAQPGHTNVDVRGEDVANLLHPSADGTLGDVANVAGTASSLVDAVGIGSAALASEGAEGIDVFGMALTAVVGPTVSLVAAPILSALLADVLLLLTMEASWRGTKRDLEAVGVRFALATLDEPWSRYPVTLRVGDIDGRVASSAVGRWFTDALTGGRDQPVTAMAYEADRDGGARGIARGGMQKVSDMVQRTVEAAEARPEIAQAYAHVANAAMRAKMQQKLRRAIYDAIAALARAGGAHR